MLHLTYISRLSTLCQMQLKYFSLDCIPVCHLAHLAYLALDLPLVCIYSYDDIKTLWGLPAAAAAALAPAAGTSIRGSSTEDSR